MIEKINPRKEDFLNIFSKTIRITTLKIALRELDKNTEKIITE